MSTTRVMNGLLDFTGSKVATLDIGQMTQRYPEPRYSTVCRQCGAKSSATQTQCRYGSARCMAANCGKTAPKRDRLDDERRAAIERDTERLAEERRVADLRMSAEVEDYVLPSKLLPVPANTAPQSERQRLERKARAELQAEEQRALDAPRLAKERRAFIEQAERERNEAERKEKQRAFWRDAVLTGPDSKAFVSPEIAAASMPTAEADAHNAKSVNQFIADNPWYAEYKTPASSDALLDYLDRNGIRIFDVPTLKAAALRCRELGILTKKPAPAPETKPAPAPKRTPPEPPQPTGPKMYTGRDPMTGRERQYTSVEVNRMSADEYRRCFPVLQSVGELFTAIRNERNATKITR